MRSFEFCCEILKNIYEVCMLSFEVLFYIKSLGLGRYTYTSQTGV